MMLMIDYGDVMDGDGDDGDGDDDDDGDDGDGDDDGDPLYSVKCYHNGREFYRLDNDDDGDDLYIMVKCMYVCL